MTHKDRYKYNEQYRIEQIRRTTERHKRDSQSENYRKLIALRKQRYGLRETLEIYDKKRISLKKKLLLIKHTIEHYELLWGAERAKIKRKQNDI